MATGLPKAQWHNEPRRSDTAIGTSDKAERTADLDCHGTAYPGSSELTTPFPIAWIPPDGKTPNRLYFADNLSVLQALVKDKAINKHLDLIYIDPPFASNSVFQSRNQRNAYMDDLVGEEYVSFMKERLVLLHELLSDKGSIYVHLDDRMVFHIKVLLDGIFGPQNFRNAITRVKCHPKNYTKGSFGNVADYILFYTKSDKYTWNRPVTAWSDERKLREYPYVDPISLRRYKRVPLHAPGIRHGETGKHWRGMPPPPGKHWQYRPETLDELDARGEIYWSSNGNPRKKIYADQSEGIPLQNVWTDVKDPMNQNARITGYPTEKNIDLLKRIIGASSNPGGLVLDCFAGSGTTLQASSEMARHWIGVDNSIEAIDTTIRRFTFGAKRMGDYVQTRLLEVPQNESDSDQLELFSPDEADREKDELAPATDQQLNFWVLVAPDRFAEFQDRIPTLTL